MPHPTTRDPSLPHLSFVIRLSLLPSSLPMRARRSDEDCLRSWTVEGSAIWGRAWVAISVHANDPSLRRAGDVAVYDLVPPSATQAVRTSNMPCVVMNLSNSEFPNDSCAHSTAARETELPLGG